MVRREQSRVELNRGECHKVQHRAAELRKVEQSGVLQILLQLYLPYYDQSRRRGIFLAGQRSKHAERG